MTSLTSFTHSLRPEKQKAAAAAVAATSAATLSSSTEEIAENMEKLSLANTEAMKNNNGSPPSAAAGSNPEQDPEKSQDSQPKTNGQDSDKARSSDEPLTYKTLRELPIDLCQRIEDSYEVSFSQFAGLLERKVSYLQALTL